jgi:hypothetical protein
MSHDDDRAGYGRPPRAHRFKKGQSGNPKGRSRGTRNFAKDVNDELAKRITIQEGGREQRISKQQAVVKSVLAKAIKGDARHAQLATDYVDRAEQAREVGRESPLTAEDDEIYERVIAALTAQDKPNDP